MSDGRIRIKDQPLDTALSSGDFIIVDSETEGTKKFDLGTALNDISGAMLEVTVENRTLVINTPANGNEVSY